MAAKQLRAKIGNAWQYVKKHWDIPPQGNFLSFKEAVAYCVGGMGAVGGRVIPTFVTLSAGIYTAAALNISVDDIFWVGLVTSIITILRAPLISYIIDNTNTKYGKFRPYIIWMPIPIVISFFLLGWVPAAIDNYVAMVIVYALIYNVLQFFVGVHSLAFTSLSQVISPSPQERTQLMSVGAFVYSLGPSIVNAVFPLLANFLFTQTVDGVKIMGINALDTYRWIVPLLAAVCYAFALIAAFGTKERMMISKVYVQRVKFLDGVRKTVQNKYFWINNLHRLWENLKVVGASFFIWVCTYMLQNEFAQSIVVTVMGTASVPGMLLAPMLIKRIGVRKLVVISNILLVVFTLPICFFPNPWLILVAGYMVTLAFGVQIVTNSLMMAQTYDYQQFKTGDRMEGFLSQFGEILIQVTTIAVAYIGPAISKAYGYFDDATVLYRPEVIEPIIQLNCVVAAGSAVLAVLSMLLWDLTDKKHAQIMDVLGVRALKEDGVIEEGEANVLETKILAGDEEAIRLAKEMIRRNEELRAEGKIKEADAGTN